MGYVDVWRVLNPQGRDFTFFSSPHATFTRIDFFLISKNLLQSVVTCSTGSMTISDHALVSLEVLPFSDRICIPRWRFNSSLLQESDFKKALRSQIKLYIELNVPTAPSAGIAWEALKAVMRGYVIQYASHKKRKGIARQVETEEKIKLVEASLKRSFSNKDLRALTQLKYNYNCILSQKVEFSLFRMRQLYYESGDKAGKLLANSLKQKELSSIISAIRSKGGELRSKSVEINNMFRVLCEPLYSGISTK